MSRHTRYAAATPRVLVAAGALAVLVFVSGCTDMDQDASPSPSATASAEPVLPDVAPPLPIDELGEFSGVASLNAGSNCTGTLIDTGVPLGPAYVLTNGHCIGDVGRSPQATTLGLEWFGEAEFFRAHDNVDTTYVVPVAQIAYSTMRYTDTGILRLDATLAEVVANGVAALPIAETEPAAGLSVVNVGVPVQNLAPEEWVLRKGTCTLAAQHTLIEAGWLWHGVWANDCPGIVQGSSGSPLIEVDGNGDPVRIAAMINTTSWGTSQSQGGACSVNRPCQVSDDAVVTMVEQTSYAQSVAGVGKCFDPASGEFSTGGSCPLPVSTIWSESGGGAFRSGTLTDSASREPWAYLVGRDAGTYRSAFVPLGDGSNCAQPTTYRDATSGLLPQAGEDWEQHGTLVSLTMPEQEGFYVLCAVAGDDYSGAASVLFQVDNTPPIVSANAEVERQEDGAVIVTPHLDPPEISTVRILYGPAASTDCTNTEEFGALFTFFTWIQPEEQPARYCVFGLDSAGNPSPVTTIEIPAP